MNTAIDWLIEQTRTPEWNSLKRGEILEIAKEKEKKQIIEAYREGIYNNTFGNNNFDDEHCYYVSTFGDNPEAGI